MDGPDRFAASAPGEDIAGADSGAIYVFVHDGSAWREVAEILPVEPEWNSGFGSPVVLQGDTLVAGQRNDACWVYRHRNGVWEFDQKIPAPGPPSPSWFTHGIALDGEWLAIGAPQDDRFAHKGGVVHLYHRKDEGKFEFVQLLAPPSAGETASFGWAVDFDDGRLAVGAPIVAEGAGAVFIYTQVAGQWEHAESIRKTPGVRAEFGSSVDLEAETLVTGAPTEQLPDSFGAAYAFRRQPDGTWRLAAKLLQEGPGGHFGWAVASDEVTALVGAPDAAIGGRESPGAAYIFDLPCLLCRADLDGDGALTFFDFLAFQALFVAGDPAADFDGDTALTFFDFLVFQGEFAAGCD